MTEQNNHEDCFHPRPPYHCECEAPQDTYGCGWVCVACDGVLPANVARLLAGAEAE